MLKAQPGSTSSSVPSWSKAAAAGLLILLAVGVLAYYQRQLRRQERGQQEMETLLRPVSVARLQYEAAAISAMDFYRVYFAAVDQVQARRMSTHERTRLLQALRESYWPVHLDRQLRTSASAAATDARAMAPVRKSA